MSKKNQNVVEATTQSPPLFHSMTAGYAAGMSGVLVGHPLDSLKVLLQTSTTISSNPPSSPPGAATAATASPVATAAAASAANNNNVVTATAHRMNSTLTAIPTRPTIRSLYNGIAGPIFTVGFVQSMNLALYDSFRWYLHHIQHPKNDGDYRRNDSFMNVTISALASGSIISVFTSPMLIVKTKQQILGWDLRRSVLDTAFEPKKEFCWKRLFVGYGPHWFCDAVGRAVFFTSYEGMKRGLISMNHGDGANADISLVERMLCSSLSGMASWAIIYPADVIRCRLYALSTKKQITGNLMRSTWDMILSTYRENGNVRSFYRGLSVTVLRAGPVAAVVMPVYDITLDWLSRQ